MMAVQGQELPKYAFSAQTFPPVSQQTSVIYKQGMGKPVTGYALHCAALNLWISVSSGGAGTLLTFTFVENVHILFFQETFVSFFGLLELYCVYADLYFSFSVAMEELNPALTVLSVWGFCACFPISEWIS